MIISARKASGGGHGCQVCPGKGMIMDDLMDSLFATFQASAKRAVMAAQPITVAPDRLKWSDTAWITQR